jgi:hypothetical protein
VLTSMPFPSGTGWTILGFLALAFIVIVFFLAETKGQGGKVILGILKTVFLVGATICRYMVVKHANPEDMTKVDKSIFLSYIFVGGMGAMYTLIFIFGWGG